MDPRSCSNDGPACSVFDVGQPSHNVGDGAASDHLTSLLGLDDPIPPPPPASNMCPPNEWDPSAIPDHLASLFGLDNPTPPAASNMRPLDEWDPSASEWRANDMGVDVAPSIQERRDWDAYPVVHTPHINQFDNTVSLHCHQFPTYLTPLQMGSVPSPVSYMRPANEWDPRASEWPADDMGVDIAPSIHEHRGWDAHPMVHAPHTNQFDNTVSLHCHHFPICLTPLQMGRVSARVCYGFHLFQSILYLISVSSRGGSSDTICSKFGRECWAGVAVRIRCISW
jgi:hypothetical protein